MAQMVLKTKKQCKTPAMEKIEVQGYEEVIQVTDKKVGLNAIIAIHDTTLGPALGGVRIFPYANFNEALNDVLRLAQGMTHKSAVTEVGFGGGKSVIIADPKTEKTPELLLAFGAAVEKLGGRYICAEDVGCTTADVRVIRQATQHVVGLPHEKSSKDPGPFTAWGVFRGIQSVLQRMYGTDSCEGRTVAIQGLGNVGGYLIDHLFWAGADLILADIDTERLQKYQARYGAQTVPADQILQVKCDVLAPCAMGGIINDQTIPHFRCRAIAGSANNQLLKNSHAEMLRARKILYAPDFVINAGGLLNVAAELVEGGYHPSKPRTQVHHLYDTLMAIYEIAEKNRQSTHAAALALADYKIQYGIGKRVTPPIFHHSAEE